MSKKMTHRKLVATALGALAASIAAPALAQDAPINTTTTPPPAVIPATPIAPPPAAAMQAAPAPVAAPLPTLRAPQLDPVVAAPARPVSRARPAPVAKAAPAPRAAAPAATPARAAAAQVEPTATARVVEPEAAPVGPAAAVPAAVPAAGETIDTTEIALIGGAALAVLGVGGAIMLGRRRRSDEEPEAIFANPAATAEPTPVFAPSPALVPAPVLAMASATHGAEMGRHEARVEMGPTDENPFLTRRARLRHARFLDQREKLAAARAPETIARESAPATTTRPRGEQVTHVFGKGARPASRWPTLFGKPVPAKA